MNSIKSLVKANTEHLQNRILWADIAKALAILCIIWGHAGSGSNVIFYRNILYSFHIPTFLVISGFLMKIPSEKERNFKSFLSFFGKNICLLIVPYLFWGVFFSDFSIKNILPILYGSYQTIKTVNVIGALWFVPCFFIARILSYLILLIFGKFKLNKIYFGIFCIGFFSIGFCLPLLENGYFWSVNIAFVLSAFILLGTILKEILDILSKSKWWIILICFSVCFTAFYFGTFFRGENLELVCTYNGKYGNIFWFLYNSVFGSGFVICLSMLIAKSDNKVVRGIQYVGTETLGLLFFHVPVMRQMMMPFFTKIGFIPPDFLVAFVAAICTLFICLVFNFLIKLIAPELVGKKRN